MFIKKTEVFTLLVWSFKAQMKQCQCWVSDEVVFGWILCRQTAMEGLYVQERRWYLELGRKDVSEVSLFL